MIIKKLKSLLLIAGCAFLFCDDPGNDESLRWRTAIDIPVNTQFALGNDLPVLDNVGGFVFDLGTHDIPLGSDVMDMVKKLTDHSANYSISVLNNTGVGLTLFGLLFKNNDPAANMSIYGFYDLVSANYAPTHPALRDRVNIMGNNGISADSRGTGKYVMSDPVAGATLCDLVLNSSSLSWRWLVLVDGGVDVNEELGSMHDTEDFVEFRLRIGISGVNSFDSLLTL